VSRRESAGTEDALRLRRLWEEQRRRPLPASVPGDARLQEIALYESWLGSIVEGALNRQGKLSIAHAGLLEFRRAEGNRALWTAAAELGEPFRSYVARLIAIEDLLSRLPREN
jgi:hypothetical protein